jgi:demethoxyubiquinone hydroxylase (CLK1/Coq7/Cat5 family)
VAPRPHDSLLREMRLALLSELGARAIYRDLARLLRDPGLREVLRSLAEESDEQIRQLGQAMEALGRRPPRASPRRRLLAGVLALSTPLLGRRLVLRVCATACDRAARWYAYFQMHLLHVGRRDLARSCGRLSAVRRSHAQALEAWILNA